MIFENRCYLAEIRNIVRVLILYVEEEPSASAFYLGAWLVGCLERGGASPALEWRASTAAAIVLETAEGVHTSIRQSDESAIEVHIRNQESRTVFPPFDDYSLLREELSIPGRDPVYEAALRGAAELSRGFRKDHE